MADLTPLRYRALAMGLLTSPYLVTVWFTSEIVAALSTDDKVRFLLVPPNLALRLTRDLSDAVAMGLRNVCDHLP